MARTGYAKGVASGHVTTERPKKVKPSHRKGVRYLLLRFYRSWLFFLLLNYFYFDETFLRLRA